MITSLNFLSGCIAVLFAATGNLPAAAFFVFAGVVFDFFDGMAARLLKVQSEIGLQLDSLADVVSFGLAPAVVLYQLFNKSLFGTARNLSDTFFTEGWNAGAVSYWPLAGLIVGVATAFRLAKFNVDTRQTDSFIGLPSPANALLIMSLPLILEFQNSQYAEDFILNKWILILLTFFSVYFLNAEIPMFSLKFKSMDFKSNRIRYSFLIICLVLLAVLKFIAIPVIIGMYIFISVVSNILKRRKTL